MAIYKLVKSMRHLLMSNDGSVNERVQNKSDRQRIDRAMQTLLLSLSVKI